VSGATSGCAGCGTASAGSEPVDPIRERLQASIGQDYELLDLLGRGGMGIVFRAREIALEREVALKVLALDPVLAPDAFARFEREAKLAARLDHPGIVPIFAVGRGAGIAYYTMRLVRGGSLEDLLGQRRVMDLHRATAILREVAAALDYAHARDIVHRDIKPANILMGDTGHASVADFGIARALGQPGEATGTAVIGSPAYMSPEQWRGDELDGRADQYALAVVAFEMLAGRRPYDSPRLQDLLNAHSEGPIPDLTVVRPGADPSAAAAIQRALSKEASDRFPNASAFVEALAGRRLTAVAQRVSRGAVVAPPKRRRRVVLPLLMLVAVSAGIAFAIPQTRPQATAMWELARDRTLSQGQDLATRAGIPVPGMSTSAVAAAPSDSVEPGIDLDSLERVIAELPDEPTSSTSGLIAGDSALLVAGDPLSRAPLATESPEARRGYQRVDAPAVGYVKVTYAGGIAQVRVDGRTQGFTPQVIRVDPGQHFISLNSSAYMPSQITVEVQPGDTALAAFKVPTAAAPLPEAAPAAPPNAPTTAPGASTPGTSAPGTPAVGAPAPPATPPPPPVPPTAGR
jgi:hypothetical protein